MGALGAIVGDSGLFWLARTSSRKFEGRVAEAKAIDQVRQALALLDSSALASFIIAGLVTTVVLAVGVLVVPHRRAQSRPDGQDWVANHS
jgi:hypothetical protein